jgi:hypothetical protein
MKSDTYKVIIMTGNPAKGEKGFVPWSDVNHKKVQNIYLLKRDIKAYYPLWRFANIYNERTGLWEQMIEPDA